MSTLLRRKALAYAIPAILLIILVTCYSWLNPGTRYALALALIFFGIVALVVFSAPLHPHDVTLSSVQVASPALSTRDPLLPIVPMSTREAHATLSDEEFEYLAGAVIMARDHCRFYSRVGGSGDQGIDVYLRNQYGFLVVVQAKRYEPDSTVPSYMVRDFSGALGMDNSAVYGHFVTTASLTPDGKAAIRRSPKAIHVIDGVTLDMFLKTRHREIAQCLYEIKHGAV